MWIFPGSSLHKSLILLVRLTDALWPCFVLHSGISMAHRVHSTHSHLGNDNHSPRLWHHSKEKMKRRKMGRVWVGGGCLCLYKTSAASQLMPQHSAPAKRTDARARKSSFSIPSRREEWEESDEWDSDAPSRCQQVRGRRDQEQGRWSRVCESRRTQSSERKQTTGEHTCIFFKTVTHSCETLLFTVFYPQQLVLPKEIN